MCSARYFGEAVTGMPVLRAMSIIRWSRPLPCMSISTGRPAAATPAKACSQKP